MVELVLENVRTFAERQQICIKPVTILTGENSSGKSTLLAVLSAVLDDQSFPFAPAFNKSPYNLGGFDTIATYKGGKYGRAKNFTIGYVDTRKTKSDKEIVVKVEASYRNAQGQPQLASYFLSRGGNQLSITLDEESSSRYSGQLKFRNQNKEILREIKVPQNLVQERNLNLTNIILNSLRSDDLQPLRESSQRNDDEEVDIVHGLLSMIQRPRIAPVVSIAPIRSKPERTYDQLSDTYEPSGNHIPFVISRLLWKTPLSSQAKTLVDALEQYGEESGLFKKFSLKRLGKNEGDPFQLLINNGGRDANLIDVGYGVSQALPVVVQSVMSDPNSLILLQQPEVHLHPRAQAALGSFFVKLVSTSKRRFVIETHSDYVIDRIRQEVAARKIKSEDVQILFFDRDGMDTSIYPIGLDDNGNLLNTPSHYRSFFLEEELRLLNRAG